MVDRLMGFQGEKSLTVPVAMRGKRTTERFGAILRLARITKFYQLIYKATWVLSSVRFYIIISWKIVKIKTDEQKIL